MLPNGVADLLPRSPNQYLHQHKLLSFPTMFPDSGGLGRRVYQVLVRWRIGIAE